MVAFSDYNRQGSDRGSQGRSDRASAHRADAFWRRPSGVRAKEKVSFGGDDIALGWIKAIEKLTALKLIDEEKTPLLAGWAERFCAHEAVKQVTPETEELMEFLKFLQAAWKAQPAD